MRKLFYALLFAGSAALAWALTTTSVPSDFVKPQSAVVQVFHANGHGSGTHLGRGHILTAAHVLKEGAEMKARTYLGAEEHAETVWVNTVYDVALLQVRPDVLATVAELSCNSLTLDQQVSAAGFPFDVGSVQVRGRVANAAPTQRYYWKETVLIDMSVAPGMSGGPVFDTAGKIAGIIVGSRSGFNVFLAVPSSAVCSLFPRKG